MVSIPLEGASPEAVSSGLGGDASVGDIAEALVARHAARLAVLGSCEVIQVQDDMSLPGESQVRLYDRFRIDGRPARIRGTEIRVRFVDGAPRALQADIVDLGAVDPALLTNQQLKSDEETARTVLTRLGANSRGDVMNNPHISRIFNDVDEVLAAIDVGEVVVDLDAAGPSRFSRRVDALGTIYWVSATSGEILTTVTPGGGHSPHDPWISSEHLPKVLI